MARKARVGGSKPLRDAQPSASPPVIPDGLLAQAPAALFTAILDASKDGIAICDAEGTFVFANAAARRWAEEGDHGSGTTLDDGSAGWGEWCADGRVVAVEDWPMARALRGEFVQGCEMYKHTLDGARHYLLMSAWPVRDASGAIIAAVCTTADINDRKRAEEQIRQLNSSLEQRAAELERASAAGREAVEALARSRKLLMDITDRTDTAIFLKDLDGRYLLVNRQFASLFGVEAAAIIGGTDFDILPRDAALVVRANDAIALAAAEPLHIEELIPTGDVLRTYLSVKFPLRDGASLVYGVGGIATDISERKRIEAALERSQSTLSAVIESSPDPIWAVDRDLNMVAFNAIADRQFHHLYRAGMADAEAGRAVPDDVLQRWLGYLRRALGGERFVVEEAIEDRDGPHRYLVSLNPTLVEGQVTGAAVFSKDITTLRHAEEQARQHQAELAHTLRLHTMGEMAASLAHEVNQPLGSIAHYAQGCRRRIELDAITASELLPAIEAIAREAMRAGEITRRVRNILRKEESHREPVDMAALLESAAGLVLPTATRLRVTLTCVPAPPLPRIVGDPIQIEQVLLNLLLNAVEASSQSPPPAHVEVRMQVTEPDQLEVAVADSGGGVDPTLGDRIFEPFRTTKPGGLGMGLAISRSIVDSHGGRLWVTANPTGGAVFRFTLAVGAAPEGVAPTGDTPRS
jgi:PAS domain S-box-containing protein